MTPERIKATFPKASDAIIDAILEYAPRYGIDDKQMPMFLAQAGHESGEFTVFCENLNYSAESLTKLFSRQRISAADADKYGRTSRHPANQEMIANTIYGGSWGAKNLGNTQPGDGWRFRGRGIFQLTGRANYAAFAKDHPSIDVIGNPDILMLPAEAVISAFWFWQKNGLGALATDVKAATKRINGGQIGLAHRQKLYEALA